MNENIKAIFSFLFAIVLNVISVIASPGDTANLPGQASSGGSWIPIIVILIIFVVIIWLLWNFVLKDKKF